MGKLFINFCKYIRKYLGNNVFVLKLKINPLYFVGNLKISFEIDFAKRSKYNTLRQISTFVLAHDQTDQLLKIKLRLDQLVLV